MLRCMQIGIIGGGVAGLQTAQVLRAAGYSVTVFESSHAPGGVWRSNYDGYGIQVPKELYEFSDYPFKAAAAGEFASGPKIQQYILDYVKDHGLADVIRTHSTVSRVVPAPSGKRGWTFTVVQGPKGGGEEKVDFDFAVNATGMYCAPFLPTLPGSDSWSGRLLHSTQFTDASIARGKRVVVLGSAKSAIDCAVGASKAGAESTVMLTRDNHWPTPRNIAGLIPFKYVFLSRFGQALVSWYKGAFPTAPASVHAAHAALKPIMGPVFGIVEALFAFQLGLNGPRAPPSRDVVTDFYGYANVLSSDLQDTIKAGGIQYKPGKVAKLEKDAVVLEDGTRVPADLIVCGTGFQKSYEWLAPEVRAKLGAGKDGVYLYRNIVHPDTPDLAFIGSEIATISNISTYGIQAKWLAGVLTGTLPLPSSSAMREAVARQAAWARAWMPETGSRASLVLLHQTHYHDSLLKDMGVPHRRKGANLLAELFMPYQPRDYAGIPTPVKTA